MDIIPVLDIVNGQAVHARGGDRRKYPLLQSALVPDRTGDPLAVLRSYRQKLGARECYLADLDAIQGGPIQRTVLRELLEFRTGFAGAVLVDAGVNTPEGALEVLACGASQIVVGLETLHAFADSQAIIHAVGPGRVVFSLDLRMGTPLLHPVMQDAAGSLADPLRLADQVVAQGVRTLLVLDLGRIGTGVGVDLGLVAAVRARCPGVRLLAGGGVLGVSDLERMQQAGCDGALVGSAIHSGRINAADLAAFTSSRARRAQSEISASR